MRDRTQLKLILARSPTEKDKFGARGHVQPQIWSAAILPRFDGHFGRHPPMFATYFGGSTKLDTISIATHTGKQGQPHSLVEAWKKRICYWETRQWPTQEALAQRGY